jgi:hypothetical protein
MPADKPEEIGKKIQGRHKKEAVSADITEAFKVQGHDFRKGYEESPDYRVETSEDYALRLLDIAQRARGEGDYSAEMSALKQLAGARGLDVWENVAQINRLSNKQLLDMLDRLVLPELLSYGVDVLKPQLFDEIIPLIWHHEIDMAGASDFVVKYLRARMARPVRHKYKEGADAEEAVDL